MAGGTDQMKMARVPVRRLESRAALAEVNFARDPGAHHPLERSIHRRSADPWIGSAKHRSQIGRTQMTLLAQEGVRSGRVWWSACPLQDAGSRRQGGPYRKW